MTNYPYDVKVVKRNQFHVPLPEVEGWKLSYQTRCNLYYVRKVGKKEKEREKEVANILINMRLST